MARPGSAGRRSAEGGDERHLIQLFSGNLQRRIRRIAVRTLHVHFGFRNRLAARQRLEAIELPLREPSLESETHRAPRSAMRAVTTVTTTATTTSTNDSAMAASGSVTRCR